MDDLGQQGFLRLLRFSPLHKNQYLIRVNVVCVPNRPFPSSCLPPLQSETKCEVFVMVISSTLHMNEN